MKYNTTASLRKIVLSLYRRFGREGVFSICYGIIFLIIIPLLMLVYPPPSCTFLKTVSQFLSATPLGAALWAVPAGVAIILVLTVVVTFDLFLDWDLKKTLLHGRKIPNSDIILKLHEAIAVDTNAGCMVFCRRNSDGSVAIKVIPGRDILRCEKIMDAREKTESNRKSGVAGALVGAAIYGIPGAIAGGWLTSNKHDEIITEVSKIGLRIIFKTNKSSIEMWIFDGWAKIEDVRNQIETVEKFFFKTREPWSRLKTKREVGVR